MATLSSVAAIGSAPAAGEVGPRTGTVALAEPTTRGSSRSTGAVARWLAVQPGYQYLLLEERRGGTRELPEDNQVGELMAVARARDKEMIRAVALLRDRMRGREGGSLDRAVAGWLTGDLDRAHSFAEPASARFTSSLIPSGPDISGHGWPRLQRSGSVDEIPELPMPGRQKPVDERTSACLPAPPRESRAPRPVRPSRTS